MNIDTVPQEDNKTLAGGRKALYVRNHQGQIVTAPSTGWEVEEIVTTQAIELLLQQAEAARQRVASGLSVPLEYWMYVQRMDLTQLAQATGFWRWRVRRHLRPEIFDRLPLSILSRYAEALGLPVDQLKRMP